MSHENTYPWIWDRQQASVGKLWGGRGGGDSKKGWRAGAPEVEKIGRYVRESNPPCAANLSFAQLLKGKV